MLCGLSAFSFWQAEHHGNLFCFCTSHEMCANRPNFASYEDVPQSAVAISESVHFSLLILYSSGPNSQVSGLQGHLCFPVSGPLHMLCLQHGPGMLHALSPVWRTLNYPLCPRTLASSLKPVHHNPCTPTVLWNEWFLPRDALYALDNVCTCLCPIQGHGKLPIQGHVLFIFESSAKQLAKERCSINVKSN